MKPWLVILGFLTACTNPAPEVKTYDVHWIGQSQPNTCWAASAAMVGNAFTGDSLRECDVSSSVLGKDCCASPCDVANTLMAGLQAAYGLRNQEVAFSLDVLRRTPGPVAVLYLAEGSHVGHATVAQAKGDGFWFLDPKADGPVTVSGEQLAHYGDWPARTMVLVQP